MTQIVGTAVQLMQISSFLTGRLLMLTPLLYGLGNMYGSYLRRLSRDAKVKEGIVAGIAAEVQSAISMCVI